MPDPATTIAAITLGLPAVYGVAKDIWGSLFGRGDGDKKPKFNPQAVENPFLAQQMEELQRQRRDIRGMAPVQPYGLEAARAQQGRVMGALEGYASGLTMSPAEEQFRRSMAQSIAAQRAIAASGAPGASQELASRTAARNVSGMQADLATRGAMMRAQEQQRAQENLANLLASGRAQEFAQAQMEQQAQIAYQQALERNLAMGMSAGQAQQRAMLDAEAIRLGQYNAEQQRRTQEYGAGIGGLATLLAGMMSVQQTQQPQEYRL